MRINKEVVALTDRDFGDPRLDSQLLGSRYDLLRLGTRDPDVIARDASAAIALLVQWAPIDAGLLDRLPNLKVIVRYGVGLDNIDLDAAAARGITVRNVDDYCIDEVADHAFAAILSANRRLVEADRASKRGEWLSGGWTLQPPEAEPVGIAGLGRIGRALAKRVNDHGFPVHYFDPFVDLENETGNGLVATRHANLDSLAAASAHLSLHLPLSAETKGIVSTSVLEAIGPDGHLVNVGRGSLVDEPALINALDSGALRWASLDVLSSEPPTGTAAEIAKHPRVTMTPHIAYSSTRAMRMLQIRAIERMMEVLQ